MWADFAEIRSWRETSTAADFGEIGLHFCTTLCSFPTQDRRGLTKLLSAIPSGMNRKGCMTLGEFIPPRFPLTRKRPVITDRAVSFGSL